LKYCDFRSKGYEVMVDQVSFPTHATDTMNLMEKVLEAGRS
jgi:hypothetical protein